MGIVVFLAGLGAVTWLEESKYFAHATHHDRLMAALIVGGAFLLAALVIEGRKRAAKARTAAPAPRPSYTSFGQQGRRN